MPTQNIIKNCQFLNQNHDILTFLEGIKNKKNELSG